MFLIIAYSYDMKFGYRIHNKGELLPGGAVCVI